MEELIRRYRELLRLLEEDEQKISLCLQGELLEKYRAILAKERQLVEDRLRSLRDQ